MDTKSFTESIKKQAIYIYTPSKPIDDQKFFQGRKEALKSIEDSLSMPGRHIIIFGDRGVGKTSLSNMSLKNKKYLRYGCSAKDNFKTIFLEFLKQIGAHRIESKSTESVVKEGKGGISIKVVSIEGGAGVTSEKEYQIVEEQELTPHFIASLFKDKELILVMDEFERIEDIDTKKFISEVIKKFSDENAKTKIIVVGISDSISELIGEHESIARNIQQVHLDRLTEKEIIAIAQSGEDSLKIKFDEEVIQMVIDYSDRFPHFAHLLSLGCINSLISRIERNEEPFNRIIASDFFPGALNFAVTTSEETLRVNYAKAIHSQKNTPIFKHILWACALDDRTEVHINDIRIAICRMQKRDVDKTELVYPSGTLVKEERGKVLNKVRRAYYKFSNPMMKAYVRIAMGNDNPLAEVNGYIRKADLRLNTIRSAWKLSKPTGPIKE